MIVAIGGGILCGWLMVRFAQFGAIGLMLLGILAGMVAWQLTKRSSPAIGWMLVAALCVAWVVANMFWLRYATFVRGENATTWLEAFLRTWTLFNFSPTHFFITVVCAGFGAYNAYSSAGSRWHRVRE